MDGLPIEQIEKSQTGAKGFLDEIQEASKARVHPEGTTASYHSRLNVFRLYENVIPPKLTTLSSSMFHCS